MSRYGDIPNFDSNKYLHLPRDSSVNPHEIRNIQQPIRLRGMYENLFAQSRHMMYIVTR